MHVRTFGGSWARMGACAWEASHSELDELGAVSANSKQFPEPVVNVHVDHEPSSQYALSPLK